MKKVKNPILFFGSVAFYAVAVVLMAVGTAKDLQIDISLFNPQSKFAISFETLGIFVYWAMWGPLFTVLCLTRHSLNEGLEIANKVFPFIKPFKDENLKVYRSLNFIVKNVLGIFFFVMSVVGYKKLIQNVLKKFVDLSQPVYFVICAIVAVIFLFLFSRIDKRILNKLESLALVGVFVGFWFWIVENLKGVTARIRFREMVAYSNGIVKCDSNGTPIIPAVSHASLDGFESKLNPNMIKYTDFAPFTKWYQKGNTSLTCYNHRDSFPSGHTVYSCTIFLSTLFCGAFKRLKKFAPIALIVSFVYVFLMGWSRLVAGAHYLTDVAAGAIIGYSIFLVGWALYNRFNDKGILPTRK